MNVYTEVNISSSDVNENRKVIQQIVFLNIMGIVFIPVLPLHLSALMGRYARYVVGLWSGGLDTMR